MLIPALSNWAPYPSMVIAAAFVLVQLAPKTNYLIAQAQDEPTVYSEIHCKHFFFGMPHGTHPTNDLIIRDIYAISSNDETKLADWIAFRLDRDTVDGASEDDRNWAADPWLAEEETLEPEDYDQAYENFLYDMGHLAPLDSFVGTDDWRETNYLSNITPQHRHLNRGKWLRTEQACVSAALKGLVLHVYAGPLYENDMPLLTNDPARPDLPVEPHQVPSGYWKIIFYQTKEELNSVRAASFMFENARTTGSALDYLVTVDNVEAATGLDFMPELSEEKQANFECQRYEVFSERLIRQTISINNTLAVPDAP